MGNGRCGARFGKTRCTRAGVYCSRWGWCGTSPLHKRTHQALYDGRNCGKVSIKLRVKAKKAKKVVKKVVKKAKKVVKKAKKVVKKVAKKVVKKAKKVVKKAKKVAKKLLKMKV